MKVLVIGGGGREHALVWKLAASKRVTKLWCAPGNAGIAEFAECLPLAADDVAGLLDFARKNRVDLTVVGPESPLALGISDSFRRVGLKVFGPSREAAALESSKVFAKDFCNRYRIPTAQSETFSDAEAAIAHIRTHPLPLVVKADGLASGKGVVICKSAEEAEAAVSDMLVSRCFGDAGRKVVIEEFLEGEEVSFIAICDGNHVLPMAGSQDHKAAYDGDKGPNTGGMGAISPAKILTNDLASLVMERVMIPASRGMVTEGMPFVGALYAGLMIKDGEPRLLEFNVRFGDPETQALMMRLKTDLVDVLDAAVCGALDRIFLEWDRRPAACVVMASRGYPGKYEKGRVIRGISEAGSIKDVVVFHAGTKRVGGDVVTDGGRVLGVTALGDDMQSALNSAYEAVEIIRWDGAHYRKDIGHRALL
ncbi:MAG: phosphoribosylamine--glycine ligase [Pseudomonadota bacterium]